ncbi:hypothetical protein F5B18DRAFT_280535 [Nemania serpens]|nr:hypothetical protein F5B18DRAFT_280535 [Nemania serpens]
MEQNSLNTDTTSPPIPPPDGTAPINPQRPTAWRRACIACTRAKRQCSKQVPRCRRCVEKSLPCTYPPPRRPEIAATEGNEEESPHVHSTDLYLDQGLITALADIAEPLVVSGDSAFGFLQMPETGLESFALPTGVGPSRAVSQIIVPSEAQVSLRGAWFLAPESWSAEFTEPPATLRDTQKSLKQFIEKVQSWMRQWVTEGHSPIHHPELYVLSMPRHIQDALTAMAMYRSKTHDNEATVHRILEDRVSQLLQDQAVEASLGNASGNGLSIFDHLSRVQSLLCYQLIRLYDGDIRMRGQAEALIPTLFSWNKQMLESAKDSLEHPERFLAAPSFDPNLFHTAFNATETSSSLKTVWRAWIVAESVRRTWQVSNVVQEIYLFFKRGWSECPGRLPNTMRKALWSAPSAYSWMRELREGKDPLLVSIIDLAAKLPEISPAELDDFSTTTIGLYGMDKFDRWLEWKGHDQSLHMPELENIFSVGFTR